MQKTIKSLMFVVEKTYPVNNHMFKIDIENNRTQGAKSLRTFQNYGSGIVICFTYNYLIVDRKRSFTN